MFRTLIFLLVLIVLTCGTAFAQAGTVGVGAIFGEPTGITLKTWLTDTQAIDGGIAWSFEGDDSLTIYADYLIHRFDVFKVEQRMMPIYFGVGGRVNFEDDDTEVGVRIPLGIAYMVENTSLELFGEIVPILDIAPDTEADINAGVGVRYYFK